MNMLLVAIIFSIAVVGGAYYFAIYMSKGTVRNMDQRIVEMALALGLPRPKIQSSKLSAFHSAELRGKVEGKEFYFTNFTKSEKTSDAYLTMFYWKLDKPVSGNISITRESIKSTLKKQFGGQDIEIGHKEFDETFLVKGDNTALAKFILTTSISADLLKKEKGIYGTITIQHDEIRYEESGLLLNVEDLQRLLRLIDTCKEIAIQIEKF